MTIPPCSRSNNRASAGPRPSAVEEGGGIPSAGSRGERGLSVHIDHRTCSASPDGRRAAARSAPRVQRAEPDGRARSTRVPEHWSLSGGRLARCASTRHVATTPLDGLAGDLRLADADLLGHLRQDLRVAPGRDAVQHDRQHAVCEALIGLHRVVRRDRALAPFRAVFLRRRGFSTCS